MNKRSRFQLFASLTLVSSLLLTLIASHFASNYFESERDSRFKEWSRHTEDSIENRMQAYIDTLASTQAVFSINADFSREDFRRFVNTLDIAHKYPGLVSFGFVRRVLATDKAANEAQVQQQGFPEYRITPESTNTEYFPITFIEPMDWAHQRVLGFDMGFESNRRETMDRARDTGLPTMSGVIRLRQDRAAAPDPALSAFLIVAPVYRPGAQLDTVERRRAALSGYVYNAFRAPDLFKQVLGLRFKNFLPLEMRISDGTPDSGSTLFDNRSGVNRSSPEDLSIPLQVGGRRWTLSFWKHGDGGSLLSKAAPYLVLLFGGAISFLWWALLSSMREAARVRDFAARAESKALRSEIEKENISLLEREANLRFKQLADAMPQIVWVCRYDGKFEYANDKWKQFTAASDSESLSWMQFIHHDDLKRVLRTWRTSMASGQPFECEHRLLDKARNQYHWFLTRALPYRNQQGVVEHWFGTCTDIQEQKEIESQLKSAVSLRDEFLSIASHELKTPLTPLRLQLQLSERMLTSAAKPNIDTLRESCRTSVKQIDRLTALIENLLDVSRIQAGKLELQLEHTDLSSLVSEVASRFSIQRASTPILTLVETPVWARLDRLRIEQVVSNLVSNALKYGQGKPIEIRVQEKRGHALIEVRDQGPGIDPSLHEKIFERFERAVTGNETSGLGLGLFIVRQIVMAHDGSVKVESQPGQGSLFVAEIPIRISEYAEAPPLLT